MGEANYITNSGVVRVTLTVHACDRQTNCALSLQVCQTVDKTTP